MAIGISTRRIDATPVAVIDFETTGLTPGLDRVVEVSVVRIEPGEAPRLVFDTLVNPERPMAATHVHGITEADVAGAPRFDEIAGDFLAAMQGCMIAAYNVSARQRQGWLGLIAEAIAGSLHPNDLAAVP